MTVEIQRLIQDLRKDLTEFYGSRLKNIYLFGSFATGENEEGSDLDIAVVLDDFSSIEKEVDKVMDIIYDYSSRNEIVVSLIPIKELDWKTRNTPLIMNIKKEGLLLR